MGRVMKDVLMITAKQDVLKRLNSVEGPLGGIRLDKTGTGRKGDAASCSRQGTERTKVEP